MLGPARPDYDTLPALIIMFAGSALAGSSDEAGAAGKAWAVEKLPEGPTLYPKDMVSEQPERFFVSEIIREKIFLQYEQEIPYCVQVGGVYSAENMLTAAVQDAAATPSCPLQIWQCSSG